MKRKVEKIELKKINLDSTEVSLGHYDGSIDVDKYKEALGYDPVEKYFETKKELKASIISALSECDDFEIEYSTDDYWGSECTLTTFKIKVESDEELEARKEKASIAAKKAADKRKKEKEKKDKEEYERLKKKFEDN